MTRYLSAGVVLQCVIGYRLAASNRRSTVAIPGRAQPRAAIAGMYRLMLEPLPDLATAHLARATSRASLAGHIRLAGLCFARLGTGDRVLHGTLRNLPPQRQRTLRLAGAVGGEHLRIAKVKTSGVCDASR